MNSSTAAISNTTSLPVGEVEAVVTDVTETTIPSRPMPAVRRPTSLRGAVAGSGSTSTEALLGLASGIAFGAVSPIVGHPFDTVKTRMQGDTVYANTRLLETVRHMYQTEGIAGFYRGFIPPLVGSMAYRGLSFSAYAGTYAACEHVPVLHEPIPWTGGLRPSVLVGALAASFTRAAIESPLDYIKVRNMVGKNVMHDTASSSSSSSSLAGLPASNTSTSTASTTMNSIRQYATSPVTSIRNLYHGFVPTLLRTIGLAGSFFIMVDYSVRYIPDVVNTPFWGPFFKGGVCATAAWAFAFPFETAKSVIQADTTGRYRNSQQRGVTFRVIRDLYRERGIANGLYRGFGPGAGRSFVANGSSMIVYSWFQDMIRETASIENEV